MMDELDGYGKRSVGNIGAAAVGLAGALNPTVSITSAAVALVVQAIQSVVPDAKWLRKKLSGSVGRAVLQVAERRGREFSHIPVEDKQAAGEWVLSAVSSSDYRALGAALLGRSAFVKHLKKQFRLEWEPTGDWNDELSDYVEELSSAAHPAVLGVIQQKEFLEGSERAALLVLYSRLVDLETAVDDLAPIMKLRECVSEAVLLHPIVGGSIPRLAPAFQPRTETQGVERAFGEANAPRICLVTGARGMGKTQVAASYAQERIKRGWNFVGWVPARSREQAVAGLAEIARANGISLADDPLRAVNDLLVWLQRYGKEEKLLVFDNVGNFDDLEGLLPTDPGTQVILTSVSDTTNMGERVPMGPYPAEIAVDYLLEATGSGDGDGALAVAKELGFHPLAVAQAAVMMGLTGYDFTEYLEHLRAAPLSRSMRPAEGSGYSQRVDNALRIAYIETLKRIGQKEPPLDEAGRRVLAALSLLGEEGVPRRWLSVLSKDPVTAQETVGELVRHGVLSQSGEADQVSIHRLQAQVVVEDLFEAGELECAVEAAVNVIESLDAHGPVAVGQRELVSRVTGQFISVLDQSWSSALVEHGEWLRQAARAIASAASVSSPYPGILLAPYLELIELKFGPQSPLLLQGTTSLAHCYLQAGKVEEATDALAWVQETLERSGGDQDLNALTTQSNLGAAFVRAGRLDEGLPVLECSREALLCTVGANHPQTLTTEANLAEAYLQVGRAQEALDIYGHVLAERVAVLAPTDRSLLRTRRGVAAAHRDLGQLVDSASILEELTRDADMILGQEDPDSLTFWNDLAAVHRRMGRNDESAKIDERVLLARSRELGAVHPDTMTSRNNLATTYGRLGRVEDGLLLLRENLDESEKHLGVAHVDTLKARYNFATRLQVAGKTAEAIALLEKNLEAAPSTVAPSHPIVLQSRNGLGTAYVSYGSAEKAVPLLEQNLAERVEILGPDHRDAIVSRINLAAALEAAGEVGKALRLFEENLARAEWELGISDPQTVFYRVDLVCRRGSLRLRAQKQRRRSRRRG